MLDNEYEGTAVRDFSSASNRHEGRHQRCWAHLLHAAHERRIDHPADPALHDWVDGLKELDHRARDWSLAHPQASEAEREAAQHRCAAEEHRLSAPPSESRCPSGC